jgi:hypothetical protein
LARSVPALKSAAKLAIGELKKTRGITGGHCAIRRRNRSVSVIDAVRVRAAMTCSASLAQLGDEIDWQNALKS